jgi:hypothetical protein
LHFTSLSRHEPAVGFFQSAAGSLEEKGHSQEAASAGLLLPEELPTVSGDGLFPRP